MSQAADPAPGMLLSEALRNLGDRYGVGNIGHNPVNGDVVVHLPVSEGAELLRPYIFTDWQAKYLAVHPISDEDIRRNRFPSDWPRTSSVESAKG
jgi:hypothetical protein